MHTVRVYGRIWCIPGVDTQCGYIPYTHCDVTKAVAGWNRPLTSAKASAMDHGNKVRTPI